MSAFTQDGLYLLSAADLALLHDISGEIRLAVRGRYSRVNLANEVARAGGLRPHASIRALVGMEDLRLPTAATLEGLAIGAGIPDRAPAWADWIEQARRRREARR